MSKNAATSKLLEKEPPKRVKRFSLARLLTGFIMAPIFCFAMVYAPILFQFLGGYVIFGCLLEFENMSFHVITSRIKDGPGISGKFRNYMKIIYMIIGVLIPLMTIIKRDYFLIHIIFVFSFVILSLATLCASYFTKDQEHAINLQRYVYFLSLVVGIFFTSYMLNLTIVLDQINPQLAFLSLTTVIAADVFAMVFGVNLGKHKMYPTLSPNKTWEGFFGGAIVGSLVPFTILNFIVRPFIPHLHKCLPYYTSTLHFILISLGTGFVGQFGDLTQSYIKRVAQIKDSSDDIKIQVFPGHGGALDRVCGLIFGSSFMLIDAWYFGPK